MIYDTTRRRIAVLLHESEASSTMIADTTRKMLENMGFRVKSVLRSEEEGGMVKQACRMVKLLLKITKCNSFNRVFFVFMVS